jgi:acyl dehydratase
MHAVTSYEDLAALVGQDLGASEWVRIDQAQVDAFGLAVEDTQWIHCDAERARTESPFGQTIVHGMLLLALLSKLRGRVEGFRLEIPTRMSVFYGLNKVRFVSPVMVGARVRVHLKITEARLVEPKVAHLVYDHLLEIEHESRPALTAETINRLYMK